MKKERREVRASERSGTRRQSAPGAARGDGGSSRQTGRTVTGEGRGGAGRLGQGRAPGPEEGTASALETCRSGLELPRSAPDPRGPVPPASLASPAPQVKSCFRKFAGVLRMPPGCDSGRSRSGRGL